MTQGKAATSKKKTSSTVPAVAFLLAVMARPIRRKALAPVIPPPPVGKPAVGGGAPVPACARKTGAATSVAGPEEPETLGVAIAIELLSSAGRVSRSPGPRRG